MSFPRPVGGWWALVGVCFVWGIVAGLFGLPLWTSLVLGAVIGALWPVSYN